MTAALPPVSDSTYINEITIDMADVMVSSASELAPRSKRPCGAHGWCADPDVETEIKLSMLTERKGEEPPMRKTPQEQHSKGREDCQ